MFIGIDFSGGAGPWRERRSKPSVWIAKVEGAWKFRLAELLPVQALPGRGAPFDRLVEFLGAGDFEAAAIDAPFGIPSENMPPGGHPELLAQVLALPHSEDRPFPRGAALVELATQRAPLQRLKPHRETEQLWAKRGVNTRSTLWNGPRGGAPFTAACLTLIAHSMRPVWPWTAAPGMLVEAFPAAQLCAWNLSHHGYSKPDQQEMRERILRRLSERLDVSAEHRALMLNSADALGRVDEFDQAEACGEAED